MWKKDKEMVMSPVQELKLLVSDGTKADVLVRSRDPGSIVSVIGAEAIKEMKHLPEKLSKDKMHEKYLLCVFFFSQISS